MAGKLELVNTFTGSSQSTLNLNGIFTDDYEYYHVHIRGLQLADAANPRPTVKILDDSNAELGAGNYDYASLELSDTGTLTDNNQNSDQSSSVLIMVDSGTAHNIQAHLKVFSPRSTTFYKYIWAACNSEAGYNKVGTMVKTTTAAGGLKIETAGTFSEIHAAVYGVKHE